MARQDSNRPIGPQGIVHLLLARADSTEATVQAVAQIEKYIQHFPASTFLSLSVDFVKLRRKNRDGSQGLAELLEAPPLQSHFLGQSCHRRPHRIEVASAIADRFRFRRQRGQQFGRKPLRRLLSRQHRVQPHFKPTQNFFAIQAHFSLKTANHGSAPVKVLSGLLGGSRESRGAWGSAERNMCRARRRGSRKTSYASRIRSNAAGARSGGFSFTLRRYALRILSSSASGGTPRICLGSSFNRMFSCRFVFKTNLPAPAHRGPFSFVASLGPGSFPLPAGPCPLG